ncbi:MAG: phage head closure protein [Clostridiales bacterium]|nr:phage head closure protein [Clostridiales bacterium]
MIENAGKYNHKISIVSVTTTRNENGFPVTTETVVLSPWAEVKTTKGMTLIANGSDFEKAFTRFTIRFPLTVITRDMLVKFKGKTYTIEYLNNIDEAGIELELQCKEVTH